MPDDGMGAAESGEQAGRGEAGVMNERAAQHRAAARSLQEQYFASHPDAHSHPAHSLAEVAPLLAAFDQLVAAGDYQAAAILLNGTPLEYMSGGDWLALYHLLDRWGELQNGLTMQEQLANAPTGTLLDSSRAVALGNLGTRYGATGNYAKAIDYLTRHLELATKIGDQQGQANALGNLGLAYSAQEEYAKALDFHGRALALAEQAADSQAQAAILGNLGLAYAGLGEYEQALDFHRRSLEIKQRIGDEQGQGHTLGNLGLVYSAQGQYAEALDYFKQARAIFARIGATHLVAQADINISILELQMAGGLVMGDWWG